MKKILVVCVIALLAFSGAAFAGDAVVPVLYRDIDVREITADELGRLQNISPDLKAFSLPKEETDDKKDEIKTQLQQFFNMFEQITGMTIKATTAFLPPMLAQFEAEEIEDSGGGYYDIPQQSFAVAITGAELISKLGIAGITDPRDNNYLGFHVFEYDEDFDDEDEDEDGEEEDDEEGEGFSLNDEDDDDDPYDVVDINGTSMYGKSIDSNSTYFLILSLEPEVDYMEEPYKTKADLAEVHAALINLTERGGSGGCDAGVTIFSAAALCGVAIRSRAKRRQADKRGDIKI